MPTRETRARSRVTVSSPRPAAEQPSSPNLAILAAAAAEVTENETRTRSGRVSKPPVRYEPVEQVEDDYAADDYDSDESEVSSVASSDDDEEEDESDADEDGNLDGFVVPDKSETSDSESDGEPPVSVQKRRAVAVKKRPAPSAPSARE